LTELRGNSKWRPNSFEKAIQFLETGTSGRFPPKKFYEKYVDKEKMEVSIIYSVSKSIVARSLFYIYLEDNNFKFANNVK